MVSVKIELFDSKISPACQYCQHGKASRDGKTVFCSRVGAVDQFLSCKKFQYAPLKRIPKRMASLPKYSEADFEL